MRTLIFGCGYLGRRVARAWREAGHEVHAVTRSAAKADELAASGIHPWIADVCDAQSLTKLPEVDVVLHAIGYDRSSGKSQEEVTCGGVRNLLNSIHDRYRRFIQISSTSVYGQSAGEWVDETSECQPVLTGGQLALAAEKLVRAAHPPGCGQSFVILRLAGIYGPDRLLSRIDSLRAGQPLSGSGDAWLNLIHVDDAATAVVRAALLNDIEGEFVIVDDQPLSRREYFEQLARLVEAPQPQFDQTLPSKRGSGGLNKRCSNRKARQELGWVPAYSSAATGLPASINGWPS